MTDQLKKTVTTKQVKKLWKKTVSNLSFRAYVRKEFIRNNPFVELSPKLLEIVSGG